MRDHLLDSGHSHRSISPLRAERDVAMPDTARRWVAEAARTMAAHARGDERLLTEAELRSALRSAHAANKLLGETCGDLRAEVDTLRLRLDAAEADAERLARAASAEREIGEVIYDGIGAKTPAGELPYDDALAAIEEVDAALAAHRARKETNHD